MWASWAPTVSFGPTAAWLARGSRVDFHAGMRSAAAAAVTGALWSQRTLFEASLATTSNCQLCGCPHSVHHRLYVCPAWEGMRQQYWADLPLSEARAAPCDHPFWLCGHLPDQALPPAKERHDVTELIRGEAGYHGFVYTDGSVAFPQHPRYAVAGWSVVAVVDRAAPIRTTCILSGVTDCPCPDSTTAELFAVQRALESASGPITVLTDSLTMVSQYHEGKVACVSGRNPYAGRWRRIWFILEDGGLPPEASLTMVWIKAHTTQADVDAGRTRKEDRDGNELADRAAKSAAARHSRRRPRCTSTRRCCACSVPSSIGRRRLPRT
jgi:ribonuclease HI